MLRVTVGPSYFYRYLTPKWAFLPLSGAGAASAGGRFNRPGVEALYLSAEPETALAEYQQGSSLPNPATLAAYEAKLTDVVDLSAGYDPDRWTPAWADWNCDWRWIARVERKVPPSWCRADGDCLGRSRAAVSIHSPRRRDQPRGVQCQPDRE